MIDKAEEDGKMDRLLSVLDNFRCSQDSDIELFLHDKAIDFWRKSLCNVYLLLNENMFMEGDWFVEAYFTLSHKALCVTNQISRSKVQKVSGFRDARSLHFVLIGQLGKYIKQNEDGTYLRSDLASAEILDYAFEMIYMASESIPCKWVMVECSDEPKVRAVYENYGFKFFQNDGKHNQYYKPL